MLHNEYEDLYGRWTRGYNPTPSDWPLCKNIWLRGLAKQFYFMKAKEKNEKIKEIKRVLDSRFGDECEDSEDWMIVYENCLLRIEGIVNEILNIKEK